MSVNLVLVGYRGTGKSTVARELSLALRMPRVSLDEELVRRENRTIPQIVDAAGWEYFRDVEQALVAEFAAGDGRILDCGGGVVERAANTALLRASGTVFWLSASTDTIVRRISGGRDRPALTGAMSFTDEVATVLERRLPLYQALAHVRIDTDQASAAETVRQILALWPYPCLERTPS